MNNTTSPSTATPSTSSGATPFPTDSAKAAAAPATASDDASQADASAPIIDSLIKRVTQSAHAAVDGVAAKVSSVTGGLQGGLGKAGDTRDEWMEATRDAIRQHPIAAVAGAVLIGAALLSLRSSRKD